MNHIYRLVFNRSLGCTQVVAETARSQSKGKKASAVIGAVVVLGLAAGPGALLADEIIDGGTTQTVIGTGGGTQDSPWNIGGTLTVGSNSQGTLNIQNGGIVTSEGWMNIGELSGSTGRVAVTGGDSQLNGGGNINVGWEGNGTLSIQNGGSANADWIYVGSEVGSTGTVSVTGAGSQLNAGEELYVGDEGNGTLNIQNGGYARTDWMVIGGLSGSNGTVSVTGGSQLDAWTQLSVGWEGNGTLNIQNAGTVTGWMTIGGQSGSNGTVSVTGADSSLNVWNRLSVGNGTLNIENGGLANADGMDIGSEVGSTGTVSVTGAGSQLNVAGYFDVGEEGKGTLNIQNGGYASTDWMTIGGLSGSNGTVSVTGAGSSLDVWDGLSVGWEDKGTLNIQNGGYASTDSMAIGGLSGSNGTVSVTGAGSGLDVWDELSVGREGKGTLSIQDGGRVDVWGANTMIIGEESGANGTVSVTGAGSQLDVLGDLYVGEEGEGTLNIQNGGSANADLIYVGSEAGSTGRVSVTGAGSQLNALALGVGLEGNGTLNIQNGGLANAGLIYVGSEAGSTGRVSITGLGSQLNALAFGIGLMGNGTLNIQDGGSVNTVITSIGDTSGSTGRASVTGAGSQLNAAESLNVGDEGDGTLNIQDGGLVKVGDEGAGTVFLARAEGSTGTINIGAAEGQAPLAPGSLQAGKIEFGDGTATLAFNHTGTDYRFDTRLVSTGAGTHELRHLAGTTRLTADNSDFAGTTTISGGTLVVNGSLGGTILIQNDGILGGSGRIGALNVTGTVAPGNSIGTLNVGTITFNPGSVYEVEVNAAGQSDLINAAGPATINGGSVQVLAEAGNYAPTTTYTILSAAGGLAGVGAFDGVTSNLAFLTPSLSYDPNNVYLTMTRNAIDFQGVGQTPNQIATGGGVESLGLGNPVYNAVVGLSAVQARDAFDQLSGELHASVQGALIQESHWIRDAANDRLRAAAGNPGHGNGAWVRAIGSWGKDDGTSNAASMDRDTRGLMAGFDSRLGDRGQGGLLLSKTRSDLNANRGRGNADVDSVHLGLYGALSLNEGLGLRAGAIYGHHEIDSKRNVRLPTLNNRLTDNRNANSLQTFVELAYRATIGNATLEPFANLANVRLHSDSSSESGGVAALRSSSRDTNTSFLTLGVRPSLNLDMGKTKANIYGSIGWQHAFGDTTPKSKQRFMGAGNIFTVAGTPIARDAAAIEAGMRMELGANSSLNISYRGQFSNRTKDQGAQATLEWRF